MPTPLAPTMHTNCQPLHPQAAWGTQTDIPSLAVHRYSGSLGLTQSLLQVVYTLSL